MTLPVKVIAKPVDESRTADVTQTGKVTDLYANPSDETRVRDVEKWKTGSANPRIDIQPSAAPSLVVSLTHLSPDPALTVGSTIAASSTKVGRVVDLSGVETQALSRYTQDAGNHVAIELRAAANLLP